MSLEAWTICPVCHEIWDKSQAYCPAHPSWSILLVQIFTDGESWFR